MQMRIGDAQVMAQSGATLSVHNPATGGCIDTVPAGDARDVDLAVTAADNALRHWAKMDPSERGKILFKAAQEIRIQQEQFATLLTSEQGKPLHEARNEIQGFCRILEYYASIGGTSRGIYTNSEAYGHSVVIREPIGICGAIIPWNVPAIIMGWKTGPALITGNTLIIKPASFAPLTCIRLGDALCNAGLPPGVLNIVTGHGEEAGEAIVRHPAIKAISFTGEISTGKRVASIAGPMMKKMTLELGGSDPMIVCSDADLKKAALGALNGRFYNCGQTCTAVKRLIVMEDIADQFIDLLTGHIRSLVVGNGLTNGVRMGPVNNQLQQKQIMDIVTKTLDAGSATLMTGGRIPRISGGEKGTFYEPTLLTNVTQDAPVMTEEVFGPVLPVVTAPNITEAVRIANNTQFGLGASVWTENISTIDYAIKSIQAGIIWVNQHLKIPPEVPFGGIKASGMGKENGYGALMKYQTEKTILIKP